MNRFSRTEQLIGENAIRTLQSKNILIVGIGGVGGYVFEMLVRSGIGSFTIVDGDKVDITNINRQIISLDCNIGQFKTDVAKARAMQINPSVKINALNIRYNTSTHEQIFSQNFDYCVDCFDSVKDKIDFIVNCTQGNLPLISAMGAGNRTDPEFIVTDIFKTINDPLAKAVRTRLKDTPVKKLKVVCDKKSPQKASAQQPASISYAPALMGCIIAKEVINNLIYGE